jgi:hypothetical protein
LRLALRARAVAAELSGGVSGAAARAAEEERRRMAGGAFFFERRIERNGEEKNEKLARNHFFSTPEKAFNHPAVFQG